MAKYPDECPVFDIEGEHREMRPVWWHCGNGIAGDREIVFVNADGNNGWFPTKTPKPLTRAARELLAWSRQ